MVVVGSRGLYFASLVGLIAVILLLNRYYCAELTTVRTEYKNVVMQYAQNALMKEKIERILSVTDPMIFIREKYYIRDHLLSSMVQWHNRTLLCWRSDFKRGKIKYAWFNIYDLYPGCKVNLTYVGVGIKTSHYNNTGKPIKQEEPRVLVLANNTLLNVFAGNAQIRDIPGTIHYYHVNYDPEADKLHFNKTVWFKYPGKQKNWVPFELPTGEVYLYHSINPPHIVTIDHIENRKTAIVKSVVKKDEKVDLGWNDTEWGHHIRGGTPAIPVHGSYMSFFHSCTECEYDRHFPIPKVVSYYFGAITFCPTFPYEVHSISKVPITPEFLYTGPWTIDMIDYVSYPLGIILDKDNEHVWVSLGHQDRDTYILKMHIRSLYTTMRLISNCSEPVVIPPEPTTSRGSSAAKRVHRIKTPPPVMVVPVTLDSNHSSELNKSLPIL